MNTTKQDNPQGAMIRRLGWAFGLTFVIFLAEFIGGKLSNSLALLSDAGHLFADVMALGLSLVALLVARLPASRRRTFGYHRAEVIAAGINGVSLFAIAIFIFIEAYHRLLSPEPVKSLAMLIVAGIGLTANVIIAISLHKSSAENLNIKSAYLHVIGDMLASVGVMIGGVIMLITGSYIADPIISVLVGLIILKGAFGVTKEALNILLEGSPKKIDQEKLEKDITTIPGLKDFHDLHIWTLSSNKIMLTIHIVLEGDTPHAGKDILEKLNQMLHFNYGIEHTTIQIECGCFVCPQEDECLTNHARNHIDIHHHH